ncbi:MAG: hypothetical protein F4213_20280 [Boseongicola sp. SB0677_bin_26]|nr:hypothetical protein [Boseongicola sp. SB0665_bin_10]MYG28324.1 hypothetical protein [Boseongicola sp. SB0677_bin_26]
METGCDAIAKDGTTADELADSMRKISPDDQGGLRAGIPLGMAPGDNEDQERLLRYLLGF